MVTGLKRKKKLRIPFQIWFNFRFHPVNLFLQVTGIFFCFKLKVKYDVAVIYLWNIYFFASLGKQLRPTVGLVERLAAQHHLERLV